MVTADPQIMAVISDRSIKLLTVVITAPVFIADSAPAGKLMRAGDRDE